MTIKLLDNQANPLTFILIINDEYQITLSYRGFHGKKAVRTLGKTGLSSLLQSLQSSMGTTDERVALGHFFSTVGIQNAMLLLEVISPERFISLWQERALQLKSIGHGYSFRRVLASISGTDATLAHLTNNAFIKKLKNICDQLNHEPTLVTSPLSICETDGIQVSFLYANNNCLHFKINGQEVPFCTNRVALSNEHEVLAAVLKIRDAVLHDMPLKPYTAQWGGSFVLRLLSVVCPAETLLYFKRFSASETEARKTVFPRKLLKDLNFSLNDAYTQDFIQDILSVLELEQAQAAPQLLEGNKDEIQNDSDVWTLYYKELEVLKFRKFEFRRIHNQNLRREVRLFLRARFEQNDTVTQIARYFYLLCNCLQVFESDFQKSISEATVLLADKLQAYMHAHRYSPNKISEANQVMGRFFAWACFGKFDFSPQNPFWEKALANKGRFVQSVPPASKKAMDIVNAHMSELPEYIQIAYLLFLTTMARANDVFAIKISDVEFLEDGYGRFVYYTSKNRKLQSTRLDRELTARIRKYTSATALLRNAEGTESILIYSTPGLRKGSVRIAKHLNSHTFNAQIQKLLDKYSDVPLKLTPRMIRAEGGRRLYAAGKTGAEVSLILGNTPPIANKHYRSLTPEDEAALYHRSYEHEFAFLFGDESIDIPFCTQMPSPLFGSCKADSCHVNCKKCEACSALVVREGGYRPWEDIQKKYPS